MCEIKSMFFEDDEVVMQLHPKKTEYVNNHNYCLHLWKPIGKEIPTPPSILVGIKYDNKNINYIYSVDDCVFCYKYIRIYIRVVEVSFFQLKQLKQLQQFCLSSASSRLLLPYKVLFFFSPPPCFRECAVVVEEEVSDDVAYRAGMVFILSHYENIFILLSNTDADIE